MIVKFYVCSCFFDSASFIDTGDVDFAAISSMHHAPHKISQLQSEKWFCHHGDESSANKKANTKLKLKDHLDDYTAASLVKFGWNQIGSCGALLILRGPSTSCVQYEPSIR